LPGVVLGLALFACAGTVWGLLTFTRPFSPQMAVGSSNNFERD